MDLDPSLAFTAVIEMRPGIVDTRELTNQLAEAMSAANPPDRWAFARTWLDEHAPLNGGGGGTTRFENLARSLLREELAVRLDDMARTPSVYGLNMRAAFMREAARRLREIDREWAE